MKISIITVSYNSQATLPDTLNSVLAQSHTDFELIAIDGASQDSTLEIIKEFEPRFNGRLKWISEADGGIYNAMNKGIAMATGDIVGTLNSDDFFASNDILKEINEGFIKYNVDAVYGDVHYVDPKRLDVCTRYYSSAKFRPSTMRCGWMPAHPSFYCRREVYQKYEAFDESFKICGDFELLLRLIYVNNIRTQYLPIDCVTMRAGGVSTSGLKSHIRIYKEHIRAYKKNNVDSNIFLEASRYILKIYEIITYRLKK